MNLQWDLAAQAYFDQLSASERIKVEREVDRLRQRWDSLAGGRLVRLASPRVGTRPLYSLRVDGDLRILASREDDTITVVDIVRQSQIDGLRRVIRAPAG